MRETREPEFSSLTSLHLGGRALALLEPENEADLAALSDYAASLGGKLFFLGRGSNILAGPGPHELVLVRLGAWDELKILSQDAQGGMVYAGAGVPMPRLLRFCAKAGLSGLEGLAGIPGTVGGACAMNAGSFGSETGALLNAIQVFDGKGLSWLGREEIKLSYRKLKIGDFNKLPLICAAIFALTSCARSVILQQMNQNFLKKKSGQPVLAWSAGCAFKNPAPGVPAGRLLEEAGFRGKRLGGMLFSAMHANFLVNDRNGTPEQAFELMAQAKEAVRKSAGVMLEPEIKLIP